VVYALNLQRVTVLLSLSILANDYTVLVFPFTRNDPLLSTRCLEVAQWVVMDYYIWFILQALET